MTYHTSKVVPQSKIRRAIARAMSSSKSTAPHFYVATDIAMDDVVSLLGQLNLEADRAERVSVTAVLIKAVALTLVDEPRFNAHYTEDGHVLLKDINVGVAISLDEGLVAPALLDCAGRDVRDLAAGLRDLAHRSREGLLRAPEMMGASFTVSNLGMFDVSSFVAIINPPQVAILATGKTESRPRVVDGRVAVASTMTATLSADHRAIDGADAARFLEALKGRLEVPSWLLPEGTE